MLTFPVIFFTPYSTSCRISCYARSRSFFIEDARKCSPPNLARRMIYMRQQTSDDTPVEEETLPDYDANDFYPVRIGEVFNSQYQVIGKLGYGANFDGLVLQTFKHITYVAAKVYVRTPARRQNREELFYEHLRQISSTHPGTASIRPALDIFDLTGPEGAVHVCLIHPPLHSTVFAFQRLGRQPLPLPHAIVRAAKRNLLEALDFLHTEGNAIHCDIKLSNLMLSVVDETIFQKFEEAEKITSSICKTESDSRVIYSSRRFNSAEAHSYGPPLLCDYGETRIGLSQPWMNVQPDVYKAPEILMQFEHFGSAVDIWNVGCVVWDMLMVEHLFDGRDEDGYHNNRMHISEMVSLLGLPPPSFLQRSPQAWRLFSDSGQWNARPSISPLCLASRMKQHPTDGSTSIEDFLSSILRWLPEERKTAQELLQHPWILEG